VRWRCCGNHPKGCSPVTKDPFPLMLVVLVVLAPIAPFAGLAGRTREWMGW
jgi:hypothetical protein